VLSQVPAILLIRHHSKVRGHPEEHEPDREVKPKKNTETPIHKYLGQVVGTTNVFEIRLGRHFIDRARVQRPLLSLELVKNLMRAVLHFAREEEEADGRNINKNTKIGRRFAK
jgi:hypothetical protein